MIDSLEVRNFQSLKALDLELGSLTVIVGDSNVGKSAFIRSLKALASNMRGTGSVTYGSKIASISARTSSTKVTLEKGEGQGSYRLLSSEGEKEYTKLGTEVPEDITKAIGLDPVKDGKSITFAGQHDSPFLLTYSGSETARTLGDLTKVNTVLEAVREANRRRSSATSELKIRTADLDKTQAELDNAKSLVDRKASLFEAHKALIAIKSIETSQKKLSQYGSAIESELKYIEPPPSISSLVSSADNFFKLAASISKVTMAASKLNKAIILSNEYKSKVQELDQELKEVLKEAGSCPMCGSLVI